MNPISDKLKAELEGRYPHLKNNSKMSEKKDFRSKCATCKHFEVGPNLPRVGVIKWCVLETETGWHYKNIELMVECLIEKAIREKNAKKWRKKSKSGWKRRW